MMRGLWVLLLFSCLAFSALAAKNDTQPVDDLAKKVLKASELQQFGKAADKVVSALVKSAPPAELANGDADISTTGACATDRDALCLNVPPGEGRLAKCLRTRVKNEEHGNVNGRRVTKKCKAEIAAFYQDRSTNVNKNLQLASACLSDIKSYCGDLPSSAAQGAVLACLRKNLRNLKLKCKLQVVKAKIAAANDYRVDPSLAEKCQADAKRICSDVQPGQGRVQACLRKHVLDLDWDCHEELFRQQVENADDIRLSVRLFNACRSDQQRFCKDIPYGANRIKDCLEEHLDDPKFSSECKREFSSMMEQRASDFRLDPVLRDACADDIDHVCGYQESGLDNVEGYDARVLTCLEDFRDDLRGDECKAAVHKMIVRQATDYRLDEPLAASCYQDHKNFCASHAPGSARVIRCLQDNREALSYQCRASLFDLEVRLAEDIDFQYPLKQHCASELTTLCKKVKKGHARVIRCLHRNVGSREMGSECKAEVQRSMNRMAQDYRLNFRLNKACEKDIDATCKNTCSSFLGQACGGTVLRCLQENVDKLESAECRVEVFYFVKMEVTDFRNDVILAETCKQDVDSFCANTEPGEGRVIECLRMHRAELSPACLAEELKLSQQQSRDVRLRPRLMKLCGEEMVVFCKDIKPGSGRVFNCLLEHVQKPNFSSLCKAEVVKREDRVKSDFRLDAGVSGECKDEIDAHCAAEKAAAHGQAGVLSCLADKMVDPTVALADACESQMSRAVRMAFWDYKNNTALTAPCDTDVKAYCEIATSKRSVYTIGVVGRCLTKQLASSLPLSPPCRKLVSVAAPKDIRVYIQESMNKDGTMKMGKVQQVMQRAREASSVITLTGWVAVLSVGCAMFLSIMGGVWLYRRYVGIDKPYTLLVPKGEGASSSGES